MSPLPDDLARRLDLVHAAATRCLARDPVALDVRELSSFTDVLYICHGEVGRAVDAVVEEVEQALSDAKSGRHHVEGGAALQWVLIDAGDLLVHVFLKDRREYYNLERLWNDAPRIPLPK